MGTETGHSESNARGQIDETSPRQPSDFVGKESIPPLRAESEGTNREPESEWWPGIDSIGESRSGQVLFRENGVSAPPPECVPEIERLRRMGARARAERDQAPSQHPADKNPEA